KTKKGKHIELGSNVVLDQERCVLCTRCVRFTSNVTKTGELGVVGRGDSARIAVAHNRELNNDYAMNVVELCPVGALTSQDFRFKQRVWFLDSSKSICRGCSRGCNIYIDYNETKYSRERVHRFRARKNSQINKSFLCDYGRLSYKELNESFENEVSSLDDFKKSLTCSDKLALVSPSFSCEQLLHVVEFCKLHNIELFSLPYTDESFKDDWLKTADMSANFAGVKELNINVSEKEFVLALEEAKIVINFDHNYLKHRELKNRQVVQFSSSTCRVNYELIFAIAPFSHESGTLINCDGIKQSFSSTACESLHPKLADILEELR
ncbi:MAG: NADH-quinone oxidoreductase subunit G, partial [Campylobacterota bacterium]|nr:NADH-quinone oxidoreductase subunit G [Campylobacterota bacterium]